MSSSANSESIDEQSAAAARSRVYQLLGTSFSYPSNPGTHAELHGATMLMKISDALGELPYALPISVTTACADMTSCSSADVEGLYLSLFDRSVARAAFSMHECEYVSSTQQALWEELSRFYDHFGLDLQNGHMKESADHLLLELEFLHYLTFLEAGAAVDKQPFVAAQRDFLTRHLAIWIPKFCTEVRNTNTEGPYRLLATILEAFIKADVVYLDEIVAN